jgi:hypothetical protein
MKLVKRISMQALDNLALTPKPTKSSIRHAETLKLRGRYGEVDVYRVENELHYLSAKEIGDVVRFRTEKSSVATPR